MEEGPTKGITLRFLRWAIATTSAPGSAIAGHPASEITPIEFPASSGFKYPEISSGDVCLLSV